MPSLISFKSGDIFTLTCSDLVSVSESIGMETLQCKVTEWLWLCQEKLLVTTIKGELIRSMPYHLVKVNNLKHESKAVFLV